MSASGSSGAAAGKDRRRRRLADEGEDGASESDNKDPNAARPSECESEGEGPDIDLLSLSPASELSEYESAVESADQEEETEEGTDTETETGSESETESGSETETEGGEVYTDEEGLDQERQSGDGEEQPDNEKPDDDEDKKNPAYVPRRGAFYEHDFREGDEGLEGEGEDPAKEPAKPLKKLWQEEGKWAHDRFIDDLQAPKSREELIAIYGYDIRASDKPPEAPPKKMNSGGGRGRRGDRKFQDFMPRMAVIDTTEDGADSVPNLGGDDFIPYNNRTAGRNRNDSNRGRRGAPRGSGGGGNNYHNNANVENHYNNRNRQEGSGRYSDGLSNSQDARFSEGRHQDHRGSNDFPSLQESAHQRDKRDGQRSGAYDRLRRDPDFGDDRRAKRQGPGDSRSVGNNNRRGGYSGDGGDNRGYNFAGSQDARRDVNSDNWRAAGQDQNRRPGSARYHGDQQQNRGSSRDDWRSAAPVEQSRGSGFRQGDSYRKDQRDQQQRYGGSEDNNRGTRMTGSGDYNNTSRPGGGKFGHGQGYEQPPRYQQEFTNTSLKAGEERIAPPHRGPPADNANKMAGNTRQQSPDMSQNVVVSSSHDKGVQRDKVQTINVTITSTTTEKKSYAKERRAKGSAVISEGAILPGAGDVKQAGPPPMPQSGQFQQQQKMTGQVAGASASSSQGPQGKRYSSQRQQAIAGRPSSFTEPPPPTPTSADKGGTKLYNPALPPPPFYPRDQTTVASSVPPPNVVQQQPQQPPSLPPSVAVPTADPTRGFQPAMMPPVTVPLQYPLPVSNAGSVSVNPALFQQQVAHPPPSQGSLPTGPPPPGTPIMAPPFLPAGMIYSAGTPPRVPPHGTAAAAVPPPAFAPLPMAYTSPPPPPPPQAGVNPPAQTSVPQQGAQSSTQPQKVYRGDITYYAPELQQPPRAPALQKRPKAAIPIIDPQEIREQKQRERRAEQERAEKMASVQPTKAATLDHHPLSERQSGGTPAASSLPYQPDSIKKEVAGVYEAVKLEAEALAASSAGKPTVDSVTSPDVKEKSSFDASQGGLSGAATADAVKTELIDTMSSQDSKDVSNPQPVSRDKTISIVAVDSRPPLTIVQSFKEPLDVTEKAFGPSEVVSKETVQSRLANGEVGAASEAKIEVSQELHEGISKIEIKDDMQGTPESEVNAS